jgi:hypothetical protein
MNHPRSRDAYADRMHRVIAYVDQHLDQYLDLETLAEVLGAYLRRRRCEVAATRLLAQPKLSVLQIAQYAALRFKGVVSEFEPAWDALLRDWLPASGLELDNRPLFEYSPRTRATTPRPESSNANCACP